MLDDDENEEEGTGDYDGEVREGAGSVKHYNDSSEEDEEEDDDEEAARQVRMVCVLRDKCTLCSHAMYFLGSGRFHCRRR